MSPIFWWSLSKDFYNIINISFSLPKIPHLLPPGIKLFMATQHWDCFFINSCVQFPFHFVNATPNFSKVSSNLSIELVILHFVFVRFLIIFSNSCCRILGLSKYGQWPATVISESFVRIHLVLPLRWFVIVSPIIARQRIKF